MVEAISAAQGTSSTYQSNFATMQQILIQQMFQSADTNGDGLFPRANSRISTASSWGRTRRRGFGYESRRGPALSAVEHHGQRADLEPIQERSQADDGGKGPGRLHLRGASAGAAAGSAVSLPAPLRPRRRGPRRGSARCSPPPTRTRRANRRRRRPTAALSSSPENAADMAREASTRRPAQLRR